MRILLSEERELKLEVSEALRRAIYVPDLSHGGRKRPADEPDHYDAVILPVDLMQVRGVEMLEHWWQAGQMPVLFFIPQDCEDRQGSKDGVPAKGNKIAPTAIERMLAALRAPGVQGVERGSPELTWGPLRLDTRSSKAHVADRALKLTSFEFRLLCYLMRQKGGIVSRAELVEHLYGQPVEDNSNTIEVFIGRLRKKVGLDLIETVRGMGYRMQGLQGRT